MMQKMAIYFGEFLGTFILVFFGTAIVAVSVLFNAPAGLVQVALVWGLGVTLAIYATRHLSCAHLNPAVSLGMVLARRMRPGLLLPYWISQLLGGVAAGGCLLLLFHTSISGFEAAHGIIRGTTVSVKTAALFGEYFPNPGFSIPWFELSRGIAMLVEGFATFLLVTMIFLLTEGCNLGRPSDSLAPVFIGATVSTLIAITAPLTQTGINPARDFGPRIVAYFAGWGYIAIPGPRGGFFWVYIAAPLVGGAVAAGFFRWVISPLMAARNSEQTCECD
ncbi:MAG: MIP/aquaporin family protein [Desulfobacterales bacterium]|jgi:glycerol uptake facilitator protein